MSRQACSANRHRSTRKRMSKDEDREKRLAAALRENLKRRKDQRRQERPLNSPSQQTDE
jgi:hypothetical protein